MSERIWRRVVKVSATMGRHRQWQYQHDLECGHTELRPTRTPVGGSIICGVCETPPQESSVEPDEPAERPPPATTAASRRAFGRDRTKNPWLEPLSAELKRLGAPGWFVASTPRGLVVCTFGRNRFWPIPDPAGALARLRACEGAPPAEVLGLLDPDSDGGDAEVPR